MPETPLTPEQIAQAKARAAAEGFLKHEAIGLDQFVSDETGGMPGETLSARWGRAAKKGNKLAKVGVWLLDRIQRNHGELAEVGDLQRAQAVEQTETKALTTEDQALGVKK